jgi:hypothetical protein
MFAKRDFGPELTINPMGASCDPVRTKVPLADSLLGRQTSGLRHGLRRVLTSFLPLALFATLALTTAPQAAPIAEPESEPITEAGAEAEASSSDSTIFLCDIRPDDTMTCVTIQGELEVCAQLPAGVIRRSYLADPDQQPSVVAPTAEDIDEAIKGTTSGDQGTIADVKETYGPGEGTLDIVPAEPEDEFVDPAEQFQIGGIYKGDFTTTWQDCVPLPAGQEITVFPGGYFSNIDLASDEMLNSERNLKILIALNTEGVQLDPATATAPATPGQSPGDPNVPDGGSSDGTGGDGGGGNGDTPPPTLPPPGGGSGGGGDEFIVPNVLGLTLPAATAEINSAGFVVGTVTFQSADARPPGGLFIGYAHAQTEPTVVGQNPNGGASRPKGDPVDLDMSGPLLPVPEPSSLALFILGLALLAMLLWVRRPQT